MSNFRILKRRAALERQRTFNPEAADPPYGDWPNFDIAPEKAESRTTRLVLWVLAAVALGFCFLVLSRVTLRHAYAHDRSGYWARVASEGKAPTAEWWNSLASPSYGPCCSFADGFKIEDVDWDTATVADGGEETVHYRVRLKGKWIVVDPGAVITSENRFGPAVVWPICSLADQGGTTPCGELDATSGKMKWNEGVEVSFIRCFLPGAGA